MICKVRGSPPGLLVHGGPAAGMVGGRSLQRLSFFVALSVCSLSSGLQPCSPALICNSWHPRPNTLLSWEPPGPWDQTSQADLNFGQREPSKGMKSTGSCGHGLGEEHSWLLEVVSLPSCQGQDFSGDSCAYPRAALWLSLEGLGQGLGTVTRSGEGPGSSLHEASQKRGGTCGWRASLIQALCGGRAWGAEEATAPAFFQITLWNYL